MPKVGKQKNTIAKTQAVPDLPVIKHESSFDDMFRALMRFDISAGDALEQKAFELIAGRWMLWLHWCVKKKWYSKHKIPTSPRFQKLYEPYGEVLHRTLELCIQCHTKNSGYADAAEWFGRIVRGKPDSTNEPI